LDWDLGAGEAAQLSATPAYAIGNGSGLHATSFLVEISGTEAGWFECTSGSASSADEVASSYSDYTGNIRSSFPRAAQGVYLTATGEGPYSLVRRFGADLVEGMGDG